MVSCGVLSGVGLGIYCLLVLLCAELFDWCTRFGLDPGPDPTS